MASPRELAALVQLWLRRGRFAGRQLLSTAAMARVERSETSRIAGADIDYGLGNYGDTFQRVPTRGHDGGVPGFISCYRYLQKQDVGFVMLLNSTNERTRIAYVEIRTLLLDYLLHQTPTPPPARVPVDERELRSWQGTYHATNPRHSLFAFLGRTASGLELSVDGGRLYLIVRGSGRREELIPLGDGRFRMAHMSGAHLLLGRDEEGRRALVDMGLYCVEEPRFIAPLYYFGARAVVWLLLSALALPLAALWLRRQGQRVGWFWPLVCAVSFFGTPWLFIAGLEGMALGERNGYTIGVCALTIAFAVGAVASTLQALRRIRQPIALVIRLHRVCIALAALAATVFFASYGLIGIRLWQW